MIIQLKDIKRAYTYADAPTREVLKGVNLDIQKSDSISITGPSGCGKSTLLNILGTLDQPSSGQVLFGGQNITDLKEAQLSEIRNQKIGFIFQMHHLLPQLNLLENVLLPTIPLNDKVLKSNASKRAQELLDFVGLSDKTHQRPGQLSGGECQRAAVVRALINQPQLLLADEPTGSLDQVSAQRLGDLLIKINQELNIATVVVTHSPTLAQRMKQQYILENGNLISQ